MSKHRDVAAGEEARDAAREELAVVAQAIADGGACTHAAHALVENFAMAVLEYLRGEVLLEATIARTWPSKRPAIVLSKHPKKARG